jgi:hypothetical protein
MGLKQKVKPKDYLSVAFLFVTPPAQQSRFTAKVKGTMKVVGAR